MEELKPCPFCRGEAEVMLSPGIGMDGGAIDFFMVECRSCWSKTGFYSEKKDAIAAWNQRAERTCKIVSKENGAGYLFCSECGTIIHPSLADPKFYCHRCGAKVVE